MVTPTTLGSTARLKINSVSCAMGTKVPGYVRDALETLYCCLMISSTRHPGAYRSSRNRRWCYVPRTRQAASRRQPTAEQDAVNPAGAKRPVNVGDHGRKHVVERVEILANLGQVGGMRFVSPDRS
jgi:hypothetical protein